MTKAYLPKESLDHLWFYRQEGAALRYWSQWIDQLRWRRLEAFAPFQKLAKTRLGYLEELLNYCRVPVQSGVVVDAVNGNIRALLGTGVGFFRFLPGATSRLSIPTTPIAVHRQLGTLIGIARNPHLSPDERS
jgi:transposase